VIEGMKEVMGIQALVSAEIAMVDEEVKEK
jgi:hypothetical protein